MLEAYGTGGMTSALKHLRRVPSHAGPRTTASARRAPFLEDFARARISPRIPRVQSLHTNRDNTFQLHLTPLNSTPTHIASYGPSTLRSADVQYVATRVEAPGGEARFVASAWLGPDSEAFERAPPRKEEEGEEEEAAAAERASGRGVSGGDAAAEEEIGLDLTVEGLPAGANPDARWIREWAAVRHYLGGAHAYTAVDGRMFFAAPDGGDGDAESTSILSTSKSAPLESRVVAGAAVLRSLGESLKMAPESLDVHNTRKSRMTRATHYDFVAPGDEDRTDVGGVGDDVDALGAALEAFEREKARARAEEEGARLNAGGGGVITSTSDSDYDDEDDEMVDEVQMSDAAIDAHREALEMLQAEARSIYTPHRSPRDRVRAVNAVP